MEICSLIFSIIYLCQRDERWIILFLAKRIREKRIENGYTQEELGNLLNVSKVSVCHWEKNVKRPSSKNLIQLSKVLKTPLEYLIGSDDYVVASDGTDYGIMMAREEIDIIKELRKHEKLYKMLINDNPRRTFDRIDKNLF